MSAFVSVYNFLAFRLIAPPFALPPSLVGLVFLAYLAGSAARGRGARSGVRRIPAA